jgi:hypothetical protein
MGDSVRIVKFTDPPLPSQGVLPGLPHLPVDRGNPRVIQMDFFGLSVDQGDDAIHPNVG